MQSFWSVGYRFYWLLYPRLFLQTRDYLLLCPFAQLQIMRCHFTLLFGPDFQIHLSKLLIRQSESEFFQIGRQVFEEQCSDFVDVGKLRGLRGKTNKIFLMDWLLNHSQIWFFFNFMSLLLVLLQMLFLFCRLKNSLKYLWSSLSRVSEGSFLNSRE